MTKPPPRAKHPTSLHLPPTTVVNVTTAPAGIRWQYIGRDFPRMNLRASKWANVNKIDKDTPQARRDAIRGFITRLTTTGLIYHVAELRGEALGCFCHPKPCHGHTLAALANILQFHKAPCPQCGQPVKASPMMKREKNRLAEFWKCSHCQAFGFQDRGTLDLLPQIEEPPTLTLNPT